MWLQRLQEDLQMHRAYNASAWREQAIGFTLGWTSGRQAFTQMPIGDAVALSRALLDTYAPLHMPIDYSATQSHM